MCAQQVCETSNHTTATHRDIHVGSLQQEQVETEIAMLMFKEHKLHIRVCAPTQGSRNLFLRHVAEHYMAIPNASERIHTMSGKEFCVMDPTFCISKLKSMQTSNMNLLTTKETKQSDGAAAAATKTTVAQDQRFDRYITVFLASRNSVDIANLVRQFPELLQHTESALL